MNVDHVGVVAIAAETGLTVEAVCRAAMRHSVPVLFWVDGVRVRWSPDDDPLAISDPADYPALAVRAESESGVEALTRRRIETGARAFVRDRVTGKLLPTTKIQVFGWDTTANHDPARFDAVEPFTGWLELADGDGEYWADADDEPILALVVTGHCYLAAVYDATSHRSGEIRAAANEHDKFPPYRLARTALHFTAQGFQTLARKENWTLSSFPAPSSARRVPRDSLADALRRAATALRANATAIHDAVPQMALPTVLNTDLSAVNDIGALLQEVFACAANTVEIRQLATAHGAKGLPAPIPHADELQRKNAGASAVAKLLAASEGQSVEKWRKDLAPFFRR